MKHIIILLTILAAAAGAHGADKKAAAKPWKQEPSAVFGVKLGQPLKDSNIISCDDLMKDQGLPTKPCLRPRGQWNRDSEMDLENTGLVISPGAIIYMDEGVVREVVLLLKRDIILDVPRLNAYTWRTQSGKRHGKQHPLPRVFPQRRSCIRVR